MNDLYQFLNGPWLATHEIPADRAVDGTFHKLRDDAEEMEHEIVKNDTGRAGKFYAAFMDVDALNAAGVAPLDADLDRLAVADTQELARVCGELDRLGIGSPVAAYIEKDPGGTDAIATLIQSGLGLPDEAYYREEAHAETLKAYRAHVERMLGFLDSGRIFGLPANAAATRIVALETSIAAGHWDVVASRDAVKTYNPTEFADLPEHVQEILRGAQFPESRVVVAQPSFLTHLDSLFTADRIADWQLWATWHILRGRAALLTEEISKANFDFYGTTLTGATEQRDRWKRALGQAGYVGQEIGKAYVDKHFPASYKEEMLELVSYLLDAYRSRISELPWMTAETRERALEKLGKFNAKIGYPDKWRSYEGLEPTDDAVENDRRGSAFSHDYELAKIGKSADRTEWFATPQTVNAFYNPVANDITFPAGILRPPFFTASTEGGDVAENFGAIGAVIGHEIGHGFDDQGSKYDGTGALNNWWTDADREEFTARTKALVEQYNGYTPTGLDPEKFTVNGELTLGENIGDLGGLSIALKAYQIYLERQGLTLDTAPVIDGLTAAQRVFISWAQGWRMKTRPQTAEMFLAIDPHSPEEFRVNGVVRNIDEFYTAFDVRPENALYLAPEERVRIW